MSCSGLGLLRFLAGGIRLPSHPMVENPANQLTTLRNRWWIALAATCLGFSWFYGFVVAPAGYSTGGFALHPDLYGAWNGSRQILLHRSTPYAAEVTAQNQTVIYGQIVPGHVEQQYAYPAFAAFPLAPFALLPFGVTQSVAFVAFLILTPLSAMWWKDSRSDALLTTLLVLSAYPVILALQVRQPTLLFAPLIAAATAHVRSHPVVAGVLLGLATAKPQLAVLACIPLLFWVVAGWRERRTFLFSLVTTVVVLFGAATLLVPSWFFQWIHVLSTYSRYGGETLAAHFGGSTVGSIISVLIGVTVLFVCLRWREDVSFSIAFSIAALSLIMAYQIYNDVMLLAPILWLVSHAEEVRSFGRIHQILLAALWVVLAEGFIAAAGLGLLGVFAPVLAARFWKLPLVWSFLVHVIVFATMLAYAISVTLRDAAFSREASPETQQA